MRPLLLALTLTIATVGGPAFMVQAAEPTAEAKDAFERGLALYDQSKFQEALTELKRATELSGSPNARLLVGRCLKELGRRAEAYEELRVAMRDAAKLAEQDAKYEKTRDAAAAQVAIVEGMVGKVVVVVNGEPANATVTLGSRTLSAAELGVPRAVEPGKAMATVSINGKVVAMKEAEVKAGSTITLVLDAAAGPAPTGTVGATGPVEPSTEPETTGGEVRIAGIVIGSVGVAGLVTFAVAGGLALDRKSTLEDACGESNCPADGEYGELIEEGRTLQTVANVALGVGAGLVAGGVFMIIFGGPTEVAPGTTVSFDGTGASLSVALW